MTAQSRTQIAALLERHGLTPVHRLGQHFLADANITRKIVALADVRPGDHVLEVGAGTGTLTAALAGAGAHVVAYEIDANLRPILEEVTEGMDVEIRFEDVMGSGIDADLDTATDWKLVANLPYNVGTPFVLDAMQEMPSVGLFVVMIQREVAERFCAAPGGRQYGLPSVVAQIFTSPRLEFTVPPQVFVPPPRVESAVVVMPRRDAPDHARGAVEIARAAFGQRRKMLRRSLSVLLPDAAGFLDAAGYDPTSRAEDLGPDDYLALAERLT